jgi:hypothetical protein
MNYGVSDHARTYCKHHDQFHPVAERCPWCEPAIRQYLTAAERFGMAYPTRFERLRGLDTATLEARLIRLRGEPEIDVGLLNAWIEEVRFTRESELDSDPDTDAYQYMVFP